MFLECPQPVTPALHYFNMWQDAVQDPHANDFDWQALQTAATQQSQARAELVCRMREAAQQEAEKDELDKMLCIPK